MSIRFAILGLLHYKNMHGYRIKTHIERHFGHMWSINFGQIYPNLKSLYEDGLIDYNEENVPGEKGPSRKLYHITDNGRKMFQEWLNSFPEGNMILRDPFLMRFIFFGFGDRERALEIIDEQIADYEEQLDRRLRYIEKRQHQGMYVRLISELGVEFNQMFLDWLKRAREELESSTDHGHDPEPVLSGID